MPVSDTKLNSDKNFESPLVSNNGTNVPVNNNESENIMTTIKNLLLPGQPLLYERIRVLRSGAVNRNCGKFVMYCMLNTFRAHDNPALQTAIQLSNSLDLPVLVLSVLNDKWNHATERRFNFILEAMKSVSIELYDKYKIPLTLNIQCTTKTYKPWHLMLASRGAAAIIVDEPYTEPYISFASQIKRTVAPSVLVDNACILTPQLVHNFHLLDRPYKFVNATKVRRETRLLWKLKENELKLHLQKESLRLYCNNLPFEPINLNDRIVDNFCNLKNSNFNLSVSKIDYILNKLVTNIDYSVGKIVSTKGNSAAGYKRWDAFMKRGLKSYDKKRNDVLEHYNFGVSRMSCYLNLGIVSPFKMMKMLFDGSDCHNKGNKNEKFLKEFLCFRELSYCFCFYNPNNNFANSAKNYT